MRVAEKSFTGKRHEDHKVRIKVVLQLASKGSSKSDAMMDLDVNKEELSLLRQAEKMKDEDAGAYENFGPPPDAGTHNVNPDQVKSQWVLELDKTAEQPITDPNLDPTQMDRSGDLQPSTACQRKMRTRTSKNLNNDAARRKKH
ncbi:hypothetical protein DICVIV_08830 [Dictyocaulus viviparus]|uniref:Uncharacterized protein n=1 Tax=Dictyocaulus viviparus TaxID=29172 RepID=A0A0D8XKR1_DICVI|nr:hypothetical protein DICVIV_08830 [Dictyocaulus viviparus]